MSAEQAEANTVNPRRPPIDIPNWNELLKYTQFLCRGTEKTYRICIMDEEQEEIRIESKEEFDTNVKYARDQGLKSLLFMIYIDDVRKFDGIYHLKKTKNDCVSVFPKEKLQNLREHVLANKWYIPVKLDEAFGICLTSAIELAQDGKSDANMECKEFIETIVPEAFRKLLTTESVYSWPRDIQCGIFDMIELLVDLVGTRLRQSPVPVILLNTLAMIFDINTTFSQKHKDEQLPLTRSYQLEDDEFVKTNTINQKQSYGWIRSFIQRFIAQKGLENLQSQFEHINTTTGTALEYNCLLKIFAKCHPCIEVRRFRLLFVGSIRQAIQYYLHMKKNNTGINESLNELNETLLEICFNYELNDEVNQLLELPTVPETTETPIAPLIVPLENLTVSKKSKSQDCYEQLAEEIRSLAMYNTNAEQKSIKKQRIDEQPIASVLTRQRVTDCTSDDLLSSSEKRSLKRKHRREQQRHTAKKESKRSNTTAMKTYDRSDPADVLRFFAPMKVKISGLYDDLQKATCRGNLREVLKIEEKLKLLRPYSARFIADENTPDGTSMQPGQTFRKGWILLNDGSMPWDSEDIQLINLGNGIEVLKQPIVPVTAPHGRALITVDYICANQTGMYQSKWILSYRQQTFGPMIWCSIEVGQSTEKKPLVEVKEAFEFVDVPLPACFDLSKPYQSTFNDRLLSSSFSLSRSISTETRSEPLIEPLQSPYFSDGDSLSAFMNSPSPILIQPNEKPLIDLTSVPLINSEERSKSLRSNTSLDFVDTVVTNIFSVAKQAGSTAKAIFNTLQAHDETMPSASQPPLINTAYSNPDDVFEHVEENERSILSNDPIEILIEMGFADRTKNQALLSENNNDLNKVIELLTHDLEYCLPKSLENIIMLRLNSLLATYGTTSDQKKFPAPNQRSANPSQYPPVRDRPRSIRLKPQEYFLFIIAFLTISVLVIYNVFMSYYNYYTSMND